MQPLLERFLPAKPFTTVVLIVSLVLVGTTLKNVLATTDTLLVNGVAKSIARDMRMRIFSKALVLDRPGFNTLGTSGFSAPHHANDRHAGQWDHEFLWRRS